MKIIIYALEPSEDGFHKICGRNSDSERFLSCHQVKIPPNALRVAKSKKETLHRPFFYFIKLSFPCGRNYVYVVEERRGRGEAGGGYGGLETFFRGGKGGVDIGDRRRRGGKWGKSDRGRVRSGDAVTWSKMSNSGKKEDRKDPVFGGTGERLFLSVQNGPFLPF